jgi:hypothetical protein
MTIAQFRPTIGVMETDDDVGGVEQHDHMLREISVGIGAQLPVVEQKWRSRYALAIPHVAAPLGLGHAPPSWPW